MSDLTAALIANEERPTGDEADVTASFLEGLRLSVRKCQLGLFANPDPTSPWWFLVDPDAEFTP